MVCRSERATDPSSGLTRVASFALHLEPVSQLSAAEKPYLSLVFAWLGLRQAPSSAASAVASGGAPAKVAEAPPPAGGGGVCAGRATGPARIATRTTSRRVACASSARTPRLAVPAGVGRASGLELLVTWGPRLRSPRAAPRRETSARAIGSAPAAARTTSPPGRRVSSARCARLAARVRRRLPPAPRHRVARLVRTSGRATGFAITAARTTSRPAPRASSAAPSPTEKAHDGKQKTEKRRGWWVSVEGGCFRVNTVQRVRVSPLTCASKREGWAASQVG